MANKYSNKGVNAARAAAAQAAQEQKSNRTNLIIVVVAVAMVLAIVLAIVVLPNLGKLDMEAVREEINSMKVTDFTETDKTTDYVKITVKDHGEIVVRLRKDVAPITVKNFKNLVENHHYDGTVFHRIIQNFMIQGGNNDSKNVAAIKGEFSTNGVKNDLLHLRGVISMARTNAVDSATDQFFICDKTSSHLDTKYAAFGYVVAGMDAVDSVAAVPTDANDAPLTTVTIEKVCFVTPNKW